MSLIRRLSLVCDYAVPCDNEIIGGVTATELAAAARKEGWTVKSPMGPHLCPKHGKPVLP